MALEVEQPALKNNKESNRVRADHVPLELAREVVDALVDVHKHEVTILSRKVTSDLDAWVCLCSLLLTLVQKASAGNSTPDVMWRVVDYNDKNDLVEALHGIHTVLSFVNQPMADHKNNCQKNLIDASIVAGVKRFAPSEYGW